MPSKPALKTRARPGVADGDLAALSEALERVGSWVRRTTPPLEFNHVAVSVLDAVACDGPLRVSELVDRERITQPGMTGLISRLVQAGLVERRTDPADGRIVLVAATTAGRTYLAKLHAARAQRLATRLSQLPAADQRALYTAIDSLNALSARGLFPPVGNP